MAAPGLRRFSPACVLLVALLVAPANGFVVSSPKAHLPLSRSSFVSGTARNGFVGFRTKGSEMRASRMVKMQQQVFETDSEAADNTGMVGEDAAVFNLADQSLKSWGQFVGVFVVVFAALFVLWLNPDTGFGDEFASGFLSLAGGDSSVAMLAMLGFFGVCHSGLASLRYEAEAAINTALGTEGVGERVWRVFFGVVSLPLSFSCIFFFINHRYDGAQLWDLRLNPAVHAGCWILNFISFWFLYPSTFNLLEVAAVDKPKFHMWETGIMRVTRHPQLVGQVLWYPPCPLFILVWNACGVTQARCLAHTVYVGNTFMVWTSAGLMAHHAFGAWNGDRRLSNQYGEAFDTLKERTSILPFAAILDGRQKLPENFLSEFARGPYLLITVGTIGAYFAHPLLQGGAALLKW